MREAYLVDQTCKGVGGDKKDSERSESLAIITLQNTDTGLELHNTSSHKQASNFVSLQLTL